MRYVTLVLAALVLALGGTTYGLWQRQAALADQNKTLTEAVERAVEREKRDRKVLVARQAQIALQARKLAEAQQGVVEALQRNKSWGDTDVPEDV